MPRLGYKRSTTKRRFSLVRKRSRSARTPRRFSRVLSRRPSVPRPVWTKRSTVVRLTYTQEVTLDPGAGLMAHHAFRANSCHDPDYTGAGHQPRYWDLMTPGWKRYTVLGSKCRMRFVPTLSAATVATPGWFMCYSDGNVGTPYSSAADAREDRKRIVTIGPIEGPSRTATATFSLKKTTGTKGSYGDDQMGANIGTNPMTERYFHCVSGGFAGQDATAMAFLVSVDYIVRLDNNQTDVGGS